MNRCDNYKKKFVLFPNWNPNLIDSSANVQVFFTFVINRFVLKINSVFIKIILVLPRKITINNGRVEFDDSKDSRKSTDEIVELTKRTFCGD